MQAVILAAGRGTRMGELTDTVPKPMLMVGGKNLIEHKINILPESVDEVILIVGYKADVIRNYFGSEYKGKKMTYIEQENIVGGTADALWQAKDILHGKFLIMMGDDLYSADDIASCLLNEWSLLVDRVHGTRKTGKVVLGADGSIQDIIEGEHSGQEWWSSTNMFVLDPKLFSQKPVTKSSDSTELGLPQTVLVASRAQGIPLSAVPATFWFQITAPEDLEKAEVALKKPII